MDRPSEVRQLTNVRLNAEERAIVRRIIAHGHAQSMAGAVRHALLEWDRNHAR